MQAESTAEILAGLQAPVPGRSKVRSRNIAVVPGTRQTGTKEPPLLQLAVVGTRVSTRKTTVAVLDLFAEPGTICWSHIAHRELAALAAAAAAAAAAADAVRLAYNPASIAGLDR